MYLVVTLLRYHEKEHCELGVLYLLLHFSVSTDEEATTNISYAKYTGLISHKQYVVHGSI